MCPALTPTNPLPPPAPWQSHPPSPLTNAPRAAPPSPSPTPRPRPPAPKPPPHTHAPRPAPPRPETKPPPPCPAPSRFQLKKDEAGAPVARWPAAGQKDPATLKPLVRDAATGEFVNGTDHW